MSEEEIKEIHDFMCNMVMSSLTLDQSLDILEEAVMASIKHEFENMPEDKREQVLAKIKSDKQEEKLIITP